MASRFKHRKPNPRIQELESSPFINKRIVVLSSILIIGSAAIYFYYQTKKNKFVKKNKLKNVENDYDLDKHLMSASFSQQSKYEKKIAKWETKKEKLIEKNPRLRNEADIKQNLRKQKKKFKLNKLKYSYFEREENEYSELIELLTDKHIILKTQMIHHYIAYLIKLFCGANMCSILNRNVKIINKYNYRYHYDENEENKENKENNNNDKYIVTRIQKIFPIIRDKHKWNSKISQLSFNTNYKKKEIIGSNNFGFGILSERAANRNIDYNSNNLNLENYEIYPYFLNKKNEWTIFDHDIYFSTIYKEYIVQKNTSRRRDIIDNSYVITQNIIDAMIIVNNKYGHISLFSTKAGIFYVDPRIKYKDIKRPWKSELKQQHHDNDNDNDNDNDDEKYIDIEQQQRRRARTRTRTSSIISRTNDDTTETKISNAILCSTVLDYKYEQSIRKLFTTNNNIYALYNDGILYKLYWNDNDNKDMLNKKQYLKLIDSQDIKQPNYRFKIPDWDSNNRYGLSHKMVKAELEKDDEWKKNINKFNIMSKFEDDCNEKIRKYNLIQIKEYKKFYLQKRIEDFLIYGIHFDDKCDILYLCQQKRSDISHWKLRFLCTENDNNSNLKLKKYKNLYKQFIENNNYLANEICNIMFVDDREFDNKQIMIILNQYIVTLRLFDNDNDMNQGLFVGKVYDINKVIPDLEMNKCKGCKWFYSQQFKSIYLFEKVSMSSDHSYRFKRLTLNSFHL